MNIDELDRDAYDAVYALLRETPDGSEHAGVLGALGAIAALRFRVERRPFSAATHDIAVTDTWTGWGRRGWERPDGTADQNLAAARREADRLNGLCRDLVLAGQDPAAPDGNDDELAVTDE